MDKEHLDKDGKARKQNSEKFHTNGNRPLKKHKSDKEKKKKYNQERKILTLTQLIQIT